MDDFNRFFTGWSTHGLGNIGISVKMGVGGCAIDDRGNIRIEVEFFDGRHPSWRIVAEIHDAGTIVNGISQLLLWFSMTVAGWNYVSFGW